MERSSTSRQLIDRSHDLKRLRDDGYDIEVTSGYLLVKDVPYVSPKKEVKRGTLVSELTLAGDITTTPNTHVAYFAGEHPCNQDGTLIAKIVHNSARRALDQNLVVDHTFSAKPVSGGYRDYYEKVATYVAIISAPAQTIDPGATAQTFPVIVAEEEASVFNYFDSATSRSEIGLATRKLELDRIAIVGLGGTGSYVLDLVAKSPVKEIHLFDRDSFLQHNAFRSPGAPSIEELRPHPKKVLYLKGLHSRMRRGIVAHEYHIETSNVIELRGMAFVFLCMDASQTKKAIVHHLEEYGVSFIDVGMGVDLVEDSLHGVLRVTASTPQQRDHFRKRVSLADAGLNDDYDRNIQVADLNALNAALAVIKWKKLCGFYVDLEHEHHCTYTIDGNMLTNEDPQ